MAWDTERTKTLLLEAGVDEFSEFGFAGARVERIATKAGVNKERIYQYFGNKGSFFSTVLAQQVALFSTAVPLIGHGPSAIADYAGRRFDFAIEHPRLTRLLFWEGLEIRSAAIEDPRREHARRLIGSATRALPTLSAADASELILTVITLVDGWVALQTTDRQFADTEVTADDRNDRRRDFIVMTVSAATIAAVERGRGDDSRRAR